MTEQEMKVLDLITNLWEEYFKLDYSDIENRAFIGYMTKLRELFIPHIAQK
jgi:hypothetical protein